MGDIGRQACIATTRAPIVTDDSPSHPVLISQLLLYDLWRLSGIVDKSWKAVRNLKVHEFTGGKASITLDLNCYVPYSAASRVLLLIYYGAMLDDFQTFYNM